MKNGKAAGPSGAVSEIVTAAGKAGVYIITDLVNQIETFFQQNQNLALLQAVIRGKKNLDKEDTIGNLK